MRREKLCEFMLKEFTHRVNSDKIHRLFITLSFFRPYKFVQLRSLIPTLILLVNLLISIDLVYTGICELVLSLSERRMTVV